MDLAQVRAWLRVQPLVAMGDPVPATSEGRRSMVIGLGAVVAALALVFTTLASIGGGVSARKPLPDEVLAGPVPNHDAVTQGRLAPSDQGSRPGGAPGHPGRGGNPAGSGSPPGLGAAPVGMIVMSGHESALGIQLVDSVPTIAIPALDPGCRPEIAALERANVRIVVVVGGQDLARRCAAAAASTGWTAPLRVLVNETGVPALRTVEVAPVPPSVR